MLESELLFTEVLRCSRMDLCRNGRRPLDKEAAGLIASVFARRLKGEPLAYILGKTEFMGFEFKVTPDVLIPRQETEILVEAVLNSQCSKLHAPGLLKILDLGTGSGCIGISLAKLLPDSMVTATDISPKALEVARYNAELNKVSERMEFIQADLFASSGLTPETYDLILSNPPYIRSEEIEALSAEVRNEPRLALDGGTDGLRYQRLILEQSHKYLKPGGFLFLELGYDQFPEARKILEDSKTLKFKKVFKDYGGFYRVVSAQRKG